jgi:sugar phosphate isomerase/epimerase
MTQLTRRSFLKTSSALAACAALLKPVNLLSGSSGPAIQFPTDPRSRLAIASWPFREFIDAPTNKWARNPKVPGMDLKDFPAMAVQKFNVHNIEPLADHFRSTDETYVKQLREAADKAGTHVVDIPTGVGASFYDTDPAKRKLAVQNGKKWVDIAVLLRSPSIRTHIEGSRKLQPDVGRAAESLKELAAYGAEKNVIIALENDDNRTEDPFFIVEILDKVGSPYLRALPDFCNSMLTHDQAFNDRAMHALFKRAYSIAHMKDSEVGDNNKVYTVDFAQCFAIAKEEGYRGYFSMEWEGAGEPYAGTQRLIDESLRNLS